MTKNILKSALLVVGIIFIFKGFGLYITKDADEFCQNINESDSIEQIKIKAQSVGYRFFEKKINENTIKILVPTIDSPFFRFACVVTFENNILKSKEVLADD